MSKQWYRSPASLITAFIGTVAGYYMFPAYQAELIVVGPILMGIVMVGMITDPTPRQARPKLDSLDLALRGIDRAEKGPMWKRILKGLGYTLLGLLGIVFLLGRLGPNHSRK